MQGNILSDKKDFPSLKSLETENEGKVSADKNVIETEESNQKKRKILKKKTSAKKIGSHAKCKFLGDLGSWNKYKGKSTQGSSFLR